MARSFNQFDQRLRDIELLLLWEGQVGNARLRDLYGIGLGAASILIKGFRAAFPGSCSWNSVERVFEINPGSLQATLSSGSVADYIELLDRSKTHDGAVTYDGHIDLTNVTPEIFATFHRGCVRGLGVEMTYASMSTPAPQTRLLYPKRLIQAGRRWHVRGFDMKTAAYRDFTLGRVISVKFAAAPWPAGTPGDLDWDTQVVFQIVPHPMLSPLQAKVIRREYMGTAAARRIACRGPMVQYVIHDLRIAVNTETEVPPAFQLSLASKEPVGRWLFERELAAAASSKK